MADNIMSSIREIKRGVGIVLMWGVIRVIIKWVAKIISKPCHLVMSVNRLGDGVVLGLSHIARAVNSITNSAIIKIIRI